MHFIASTFRSFLASNMWLISCVGDGNEVSGEQRLAAPRVDFYIIRALVDFSGSRDSSPPPSAEDKKTLRGKRKVVDTRGSDGVGGEGVC